MHCLFFLHASLRNYRALALWSYSHSLHNTFFVVPSCHDRWNNITGEWTYQVQSPQSSRSPPPAQPMTYVNTGPPSPPLHPPEQRFISSPTSHGGAQTMASWGSLPSAVRRGGWGNEAQGAGNNGPVQGCKWEKCYNDQGRAVWIHSVTGKLTEIDPYE